MSTIDKFMEKTNIKNLTINELREELKKIGEQPYRAQQIFSWIYKKNANSLDDMANLPKNLIFKLSRDYCLDEIKLKEVFLSRDKTRKHIFRLKDGFIIESALIPSNERNTLCISTQVGCKYNCSFCASGIKGFKRNLATFEIIDQILLTNRSIGSKISNFVFMGMGEPLDNFENLKKSILIMTDKKGLSIGAGRITVSTSGIIPGIENLMKLKQKVNLSVSLHACDDNLRSLIMPVNKIYSLADLVKSCEKYLSFTKGRITLEYVLLGSLNDSSNDAVKLSKMAKRLKAKVNLLNYSKVAGLSYRQSGNTEQFMDKLIHNGVNVTLRQSKGDDIKAACGQLAWDLYNEI